jgi:N-acetylmuramoyl-L-alanine amidase
MSCTAAISCPRLDEQEPKQPLPEFAATQLRQDTPVLCAWRAPTWVLLLVLFVLPFPAYCQTYEEKAVAAILMAEAWSEGTQGMMAVAEVIHQRSVEKQRTPLQVISTHRGGVHTFSCLNGTTMDALIEKFSGKADYDKALDIAQTLCQTPENLPGLTHSANHFTLATEQPYWAYGKQPVAVIGRHAFYKLESY